MLKRLFGKKIEKPKGPSLLSNIVTTATTAFATTVVKSMGSDSRNVTTAAEILQTVVNVMKPSNAAGKEEEKKKEQVNEEQEALFAKLHEFLKIVKKSRPEPYHAAADSSTALSFEKNRKAKCEKDIQEWDHIRRPIQGKSLIYDKNKLPEQSPVRKAYNEQLTYFPKAAGISVGANLSLWWETHGQAFLDEEMRPDLRWLKPHHLQALCGNDTENGEVPDLLVGANLGGFNLSGVDFSRVNLAGCNISNAVMQHTKLSMVDYAIAIDTDLAHAAAACKNAEGVQLNSMFKNQNVFTSENTRLPMTNNLRIVGFPEHLMVAPTPEEEKEPSSPTSIQNDYVEIPLSETMIKKAPPSPLSRKHVDRTASPSGKTFMMGV